jgi:hypothetical protein
MTCIEYAVTVASRSSYHTCQIRNRSLHVPVHSVFYLSDNCWELLTSNFIVLSFTLEYPQSSLMEVSGQ